MGVEPTFLLGENGARGLSVSIQTAIEHEVEASLAGTLPDVDLREVQVVGAGSGGTLRVVIDHPQGVDHELCAATTRALDRAGLRERFAIEVSSPGPEPPLRTLEHYRAAIGLRVSLRLAVGAAEDRQRSISGTLTRVEDDRVQIDAAGGAEWVATSHIRRARVVESRSTS